MGQSACHSDCQCGQSNRSHGIQGSSPSNSSVPTMPFAETQELVFRQTRFEQPSPKAPALRRMKNGIGELDHVVKGDDEVDVDSDGTRPAQFTIASTRTGRIKRFQEAGMLNTMFEWLWPVISDFVSKQIIREVQPAVKKALRKAGVQLEFKVIEEKCHLGRSPVKFEGMTVHESCQQSASGVLQNVTFKTNVEWHADLEVKFVLSMVEVSIKKIDLSGELLVELVGIQPDRNMVQGVRAFFPNAPRVDIDIKAKQDLLNSLLGLTWVKNLIVAQTVGQMCQVFVAPNTIGKTLAPEALDFRVTRPRPVGILDLTVVDASDLIAKDRSFFKMAATSDPYVVVQCGAHRSRSKTIKKDLNPSFDFRVMVPVESLDYQRLKITLFDEDYKIASDFLGELDIATETAANFGAGVYAFDLADEKQLTGNNGKLRLSATWRPLSWDTRQHMVENNRLIDDRGLVFVGVVDASHVPLEGAGSLFWIEASCTGVSSEYKGTPDLQTSKRITQKARPVGAQSAHEHVFQRKLALLRKYKMEDHEIADILDVDQAQVKKVNGEVAALKHHLTWSHGFEFLVETADQAVVTLTLKCLDADNDVCSRRPSQNSSKGDGVRILGTCELHMTHHVEDNEIVRDRTVQLQGTNILLRLCVQVHFLASPCRAP